jgi:all-trans-retinol 13,14-reductase
MARVVIIGSGVAGLTAAAYLAQEGRHVTVLEQFPTIGGVTATIRNDGYSWDLGPMLLEGFGPGEPAADILDDLNAYQRIALLREDRGVVFPDYSIWRQKEYRGPYWRRDYLKGLFPSESEGLNRYYVFYDRVMDLAAYQRKAGKSSGSRKFLYEILKAAQYLMVRRWVGKTAEEVMNHFFTDPRLKALFTAILADFVTRPSQFPGLGVPFLNIETPFDKRIPLQITKAGPRPSYNYIMGGCQSLVEALAKTVRDHGGEIHTGTTVSRILVEGGRVTGVRLQDGSIVGTDLIIASGGARETYLDLVGREHLPADFIARVEDVPLMESVHMVHLATDIDMFRHQPAALCYYYGNYDIESGIDRCLQGTYHEGKDGFLIYVPSLHSPDMAPPGKHAVTVYTIAPNDLSDGVWSKRREELTDKLLAECEVFIPDLRKRSRVVEIMTPDDFKKRTHLKHHAFGGRAPVMGKKGGPHRGPLRGLWFIGSQSEKEGGGVCGTMEASRKVIMMIRKEKY